MVGVLLMPWLAFAPGGKAMTMTMTDTVINKGFIDVRDMA